ncbi:MAG: hypothetical protein GTO41_17310 [Burkholderiales bacterium]|nr:hypothetical protein [Burkholderiales bacterium]
MRLPKPLYEALPFFLIIMGTLLIVLAVNRYEYAPTLLTWLIGIFSLIGGTLILAVRLIYRIRTKAEED